jgi:hypothetical protein
MYIYSSESGLVIPENKKPMTAEEKSLVDKMYEKEDTYMPGVSFFGGQNGATNGSLRSIPKCSKCRENFHQVIGSQLLPYRQLLIVIVPPIRSAVASQVRQMHRAWSCLYTRPDGQIA